MSKFQMIFAMAAALAVIATMAGLGVILALAMAREDGARAAEERAAAGDLEPRVPGWTLLGRAFVKRCPRCGRGAVFASYFRMNPRCSECGAVFWVDRGEWLGAFVIDWACATGLTIVVWAALEAFTTLPQIVEIAIISGFSSQSHLSHWFLRHVGVSPASYRRRQRSAQRCRRCRK